MADTGTQHRLRTWIVLAVLLVAALVGSLLWWLGPAEEPALDVVPTPTPTTPAAAAAQQVVKGRTLAPRCRPEPDPFVPTRISVADVTSGAPVVALARDANDVPGVPSLSGGGKGVFAWDRPPGISPGSDTGNVLLNAHTWPDGSALGNQLLAELEEGDELVVMGADGERLCYTITERVEIPVEGGFPRYYKDIGSPQVAIIVCSGVRRGPGDWSHRTIWFGRPLGTPADS